MVTIDKQLNERILQQIKWQHGILPSGRISKHKCFVLKAMPVIKLLVDKGKRPAALLVTQSEWTANLVESAALCNLYDDSTLQALAECAMIFHRPEKPKEETFHLLYYDTHAYFRVSDILQPTAKFQQALDPVLEHWPKDPARAWQGLCRVWYEFGFLWPRKIMLGLRHHFKNTYSVTNPNPNRLNELRQAQAYDEASAQLEDICARRVGQEYQSQQDSPTDSQLKDIALTWTIIQRSDLRPIHEFLQPNQRDIVLEMINSFVHRIPSHRPIKLRSLSTGGYLSWRAQPHHATTATANVKTSSSSPSSSLSASSGATVLFATCPLAAMAATQSQYLWRLDWALPFDEKRIDMEAHYAGGYIRCGSRVYLYPATTTTTGHTNDKQHSRSSTKLLTRSSPVTSASHVTQDQHHPTAAAERLRSLELLTIGQGRQSYEHQWTIEMENLGLEYEDDLAADTSRNVDVAIGRRRPVLHGDIIALRQVHYLCSLASPTTTTTTSTSPLAALKPTIPAALTTAAIASPSMTNSSTSLSSGSHHHPHQQRSSILSSPTMGGGGSSTANTSIITNSNDPGILRSVLAKEIGFIQGSFEHFWMIEVASSQDMQYHQCVIDPKKESSSSSSSSSPPQQQQPTKPSLLTTEALNREAPLTDLGRQLKAYSDSFEKLVEPTTTTTTGMPSSSTGEILIHPAPAAPRPIDNDDEEEEQDNDDDWDVCASGNAEPFIRLYASKQRTKTVSHLVKAGSLAHLVGKHFTH